MVYDPCIGQFDYVQEQVPTYDFIKSHADLFNFDASFMSQLESMHESCGYKAFQDKYFTFPAACVQSRCEPHPWKRSPAEQRSHLNVSFRLAACRSDPLSEELHFALNNVKAQTIVILHHPWVPRLMRSSASATRGFKCKSLHSASWALSHYYDRPRRQLMLDQRGCSPICTWKADAT